jgi:spore coat protein CotH
MEGYTGYDCSSTVFDGGEVPWGDVFPDPVYTSADKYKDDHPVWNISSLMTIRIEMSPSDLLYQLTPANAYSVGYVPATVHVDNGVVRETLKNVGVHIKGAYSRADQKKGWSIKFNEFVSGQKLKGVKKMGLKAGSDPDDVLVKSMLYKDFSRAMGVAVQRASYALLIINGVFSGVYFMHEDIGPDFLAARIAGDSGDGNLMKLCRHVHLQYFGPDQSIYENIHGSYPSGRVDTLFLFSLDETTCSLINCYLYAQQVTHNMLTNKIVATATGVTL